MNKNYIIITNYYIDEDNETCYLILEDRVIYLSKRYGTFGWRKCKTAVEKKALQRWRKKSQKGFLNYLIQVDDETFTKYNS